MHKLLIGLVIALVIGLTIPAFAEPTVPHRRLTWENPVTPEPNLAGFWIYYAGKSEPEPRLYSNLRRVQLPTVASAPASEVLIIDLKPDATSELCFKITAYETSGNESEFSNEACGWFGMPNRVNLRGMP